MQKEIEVKFLNVDHDDVRARLTKLGAVCEQPMRLMRRKMFDYPDNRLQKSNMSQRLRIRDEGNRVTINYKAGNDAGGSYAREIESIIGSFDDVAQILEAVGLVCYSFQESKRETWKHKDVEIVLDEWPWVNCYIEIEGPTESSIKVVADGLGFNWEDSRVGSVDVAYCAQYPGMTEHESIGDLAEVRFSLEVPDYFIKRRSV